MDRADIDVILEARKILWGKDEKLSTQEDFTKLWNAVNAEIREKLLEGKASQLIDVGTFSVSQWRHGGKVVQSSPVFALSGRLLRKFGVRECRKWAPEVAPRLLTAASVSGASAQGLRGAAKCLEALQSALRGCVATGYASLVFPGIGTLLVARHVARMTFEKSFLEEFEKRERAAGRGFRELLAPRPRKSPPPSPPVHMRSLAPPPQSPARRPLLFMGPPPAAQYAQSAYTPQRQRSPIGQRLSRSDSNPRRCEARRSGPLSELQRQLRANASSRGAAGARAACNLTSCSRHSRHPSRHEPRRIPDLPAMKQRREEMEIAEFYRRKEREKVDREGVQRLYRLDCEMSLAKLVWGEAARERRRRARLRRAAQERRAIERQAQGDTLSTTSDQIKKAVEQGSAKAGVQLKSSDFHSTGVCPG